MENKKDKKKTEKCKDDKASEKRHENEDVDDLIFRHEEPKLHSDR